MRLSLLPTFHTLYIVLGHPREQFEPVAATEEERPRRKPDKAGPARLESKEELVRLVRWENSTDTALFY